MTTVAENIPPRMQTIIEDFSLCEGQEKLELLLEYADKLPPLPEWLQEESSQMEQVHECMSPVFLHGELHNGAMVYYVDIPREAPTVRGYASLLLDGLAGATPEQVLKLPDDFFYQMGIHKVLSPQRLNGITAVLAYMKRLALKQAA